MSLDEKIKAEAEVQKKRKEAMAQFEKVPWYKPKTGDNLFRILPHPQKPGDEMFFRRVRIHFGVEINKSDGSGTVALSVRCLRDFGEACDLCDLYEQVQKDKALREALNVVRPVDAQLYNVLGLEVQADKTVTGECFVWSMPATVHQMVFAWIEEGLGAEVVDLEKGRTWKLKKEVTPGKTPAKGTKYTLFPATAATAVPAQLRAKLAGMYDLNKLYQEKYAAEIKRTAVLMRRKLGVLTPTEAGVRTSTKEAFAGIAGDGFATALPGAAKAAVAAAPVVPTPAVPATDGFMAPKTATVTVEDAELDAELKALGV